MSISDMIAVEIRSWSFSLFSILSLSTEPTFAKSAEMKDAAIPTAVTMSGK
jgi:hypothetical protein